MGLALTFSRRQRRLLACTLSLAISTFSIYDSRQCHTSHDAFLTGNPTLSSTTPSPENRNFPHENIMPHESIKPSLDPEVITTHAFIEKLAMIFYFQTEIRYASGLVLTHFPDNQMEKVHPDGTREVIFPDGSRARFTASGKVIKG